MYVWMDGWTCILVAAGCSARVRRPGWGESIDIIIKADPEYRRGSRLSVCS